VLAIKPPPFRIAFVNGKLFPHLHGFNPAFLSDTPKIKTGYRPSPV